jgi:UDP-glucose 4-epimerase
MKICVTGAAGFIGSHVCAGLAVAHEVVGIDDLSTGDVANLAGLEVDLTQGSILDPVALERATAGADAIVHLAARPSVPRSLKEPAATHEANATGTVRVLEAARACGAHVVLASSSSVYGANPTLPKHEDLVPSPVSPYAASKLAAEQYALAWQRSFGIPVLAFRFFNVFGPRQAPGHAYAAVIPSFVHAALLGQPLTMHGDGTQSRDFTYVGTVTEVIIDAIERRVSADGPVNLAFGSRTTLLELVADIERILGTSVAVEHTERRAGDVDHSQADNRRLRALFPEIEPVPLDHGLLRTIDWMRTWVSDDHSRRDRSSHTR